MINPEAFHFIRPYWLLAMIPALAIVVLLLRSKLSRGLWSAVCDAELLPYLLQEKAGRQNRGLIITGALAAFLAIVALAGPSWERIPAPVFRNASALMIILDLSRSMDAEDIKPSRLIRARYKIADILKQRKDGQTALLVYAGDAFTVTPLTDDTETIASQLSALSTDIMPSPGSNTAQALEKAVDLFKQAGLLPSGAQEKGQIILVTDGIDDAAVAAAATALSGIRLSVLGVGTADGAPIALPGGGFIKDEQGAIVIPKLNAEDLSRLAQAGHGIYQTISADDTDIQALLSEIKQPVAQNINGQEQTDILLDQWEDKGPWLLLPVLLLASLMFRKGVLCFALLLILPLPKNSYARDWQDLWQTKDQQAQQAYKRQQYERAAELFENPDWKAAAEYKAGAYTKALAHPPAQTSDSFYNQGNALAQSGQLDQAIKAYEKALAIKPDDADAQFNKALVEKELEKQKKQQDKQKKDEQQASKEKPKQNQDQENKPSEASDNKNNDEKPEQKPERSAKDQESEPEKQEASKQQEQAKKQPEQQKQTDAEKTEQDKAQQQKSAEPQQAESPVSDEKQQADEQWLKRIPDDPAGLLKRKFKYQYGQREHQSGNNSQNW